MTTALFEIGMPAAGKAASPTASIPDFERLLGPGAWARLPQAVRARFDVNAHAHEATVYVGATTVRASMTGRAFAHLCRLVGTPVAPYVGDDVPLRVRVYRTNDGVVWERHYQFAHGDCVVASTKQSDGDGLIEKLGAGLHMKLRVFEAAGALHFVSDGYFFRAGRLSLRLPDWFLPGGTHVTHEDLGDGRFRFTMLTHHRWFGELYFQDGIFSGATRS
jgi:hypothetical protein